MVLRLLRGESLDAVSREVGVEVYRLEVWKARALAGMELGLKAQAGEPLAAELDAAKRHIGELSMEIELLGERARATEVATMSATTFATTARRYGLERVCRTWERSRSAPDLMWGTDGVRVFTADDGWVWTFAAVDH